MRNNFIGVFFIALFGALLCVFYYASSTDWSIHDWNGVISWATAENLDIDRRIGSFYRSFGIFFAVFFALLFVISRWAKKLFTNDELSLLNYLSLGGCMLLFFKLIGSEVQESLMLVFILQLLVIVYALADFVSGGMKRIHSLAVTELAWSMVMGAAAFFLFNSVALIFHRGFEQLFTPLLLIFSTCTVLVCLWLRKKNAGEKINRAIFIFRFAALIPAWMVLSQEIYMILNQHNYFHLDAATIFFAFISLTIILTDRSFRSERKKVRTDAEAKNVIANFYYPWLIIGLIAFTFYRPVAEAPQELFEQANPALSIQQLFEFHKLPWLQTFSSHSGADFLTGVLYSVLNGFSGLSYHCYDFLVVVLYILLLYYTLKNLTGNPYLAMLSVLIYPYINLLLPQYHNVMLLPLLLLAATLNAPTLRNYFLLFSCFMLMPLWRYDLGYGNILALSGSLVLFLFLKKELHNSFPALRKGFLLALILPALLFIAALALTPQSLLITMKDAVAYLNSAQAFGIKDLANEKNLIYYIHYFILPCTVAVCFFFALWRLVLSREKREKVSFSTVAIIFLSIYYFVNFHRGLIRHNLAEGWDTAFTSFGFFIVTATAYDFLRTKNRTLQLAAICAFATVMLAQFKYPQPELSKNNYYSELTSAIRNPVIAQQSKSKINRAPVNPDFAKETFADLKNFLDNYFTYDATFLDFSNTPMLYLYTHRETPNYFNQIPHTALNYYLQQRFLEELKQYKVPVVLFSNEPAQWWDSFDGIPNTYRHYLIAEYIYEHYVPYIIMNKHAIWIEKGSALFNVNHTEFVKDTVSIQPKDEQLKYLPYIMGKSYPVVMNDTLTTFKAITISSSIYEKNPGRYEFPELTTAGQANYMMIKVKNLSGKKTDAHLIYGNSDQNNGTFSFYLKEDSEDHVYLLRLSTQYNWYTKANNNFYIIADGKCEVSQVLLMKGKY